MISASSNVYSSPVMSSPWLACHWSLGRRKPGLERRRSWSPLDMPIEQSMSAILLLVLRAVLALALYLFIGWALWLIWRDLKTHSVLLASRQPPPLTLTIESEEAITPLRFTTPVITIGRDPASDYVLDDIAVSA